MNSIWNKNKALFKKRFPDLVNFFSNEISRIDEISSPDDITDAFPFWEIKLAKNGSVTACENSVFLHSSYNPEREAEKTVVSVVGAVGEKYEAAVFYGFALGYAPLFFAEKFPEKKLILVEPDAKRFFAALFFVDLEKLFSHQKLIVALACPPETVLSIIQQAEIAKSVFFNVKAHTAHAENYFTALQTLVERNKKTEETNTATLERFAKLWQRNSCKNLRQLAECDGVNIYKKRAAQVTSTHSLNIDLPFLVLAAGPSLQNILPCLAEMKKRSVVVAVDTALRACLSVDVEPDFIVLTDPQYYAYRHIAGLSAPSSVLIAESAVYPAVFRFNCRKIVLCSSLFPLGQFFEKSIGAKGDLGSGGSVSSVAWNFAVWCGAKEIFCSGLDLAFPKKQTHVTGATQEQAEHFISTRLYNADTSNAASLCSPLREKGLDYDGGEVATDKRMKLFAWWFESRIASCPEVKTYIFSKSGLMIPGIVPVEKDVLLSRPEISSQKDNFFAAAESTESTENAEQKDCLKKFDETREKLFAGLMKLQDAAKRGKSICRDAAKNTTDRAFQKTFMQLAKIDAEISKSDTKEIAALVFPTEKQLEKLFAEDTVLASFKNNPHREAVRKSEIIYNRLYDTVRHILISVKITND